MSDFSLFVTEMAEPKWTKKVVVHPERFVLNDRGKSSTTVKMVKVQQNTCFLFFIYVIQLNCKSRYLVRVKNQCWWFCK